MVFLVCFGLHINFPDFLNQIPLCCMHEISDTEVHIGPCTKKNQPVRLQNIHVKPLFFNTVLVKVTTCTTFLNF